MHQNQSTITGGRDRLGGVRGFGGSGYYNSQQSIGRGGGGGGGGGYGNPRVNYNSNYGNRQHYERNNRSNYQQFPMNQGRGFAPRGGQYPQQQPHHQNSSYHQQQPMMPFLPPPYSFNAGFPSPTAGYMRKCLSCSLCSNKDCLMLSP